MARNHQGTWHGGKYIYGAIHEIPSRDGESASKYRVRIKRGRTDVRRIVNTFEEAKELVIKVNNVIPGGVVNKYRVDPDDPKTIFVTLPGGHEMKCDNDEFVYALLGGEQSPWRLNRNNYVVRWNADISKHVFFHCVIAARSLKNSKRITQCKWAYHENRLLLDNRACNIKVQQQQ